MSVSVERLPLKLTPDPSRVIMRFFGTGNDKRVREIIGRVMAFPESQVENLLDELGRNFRPKHESLDEALAEHFDMIREAVPNGSDLTESRRLLLGACFTMEYALESVALFNPSIVPTLRQEGVPEGSLRFLMSLRATGEGHVSSIVFRVGMMDADGDMQLEPVDKNSRPLKASLPNEFAKATFRRDLATLGITDEQSGTILDQLRERFTRQELFQAIDQAQRDSTCIRVFGTDGG